MDRKHKNDDIKKFNKKRKEYCKNCMERRKNQSNMGKTEQNKSVKAFNEQAANQEKTEKKEKEVEEEERNSDDENEIDRSDNSKDDISNSLLIESKEEGTNKTEKELTKLPLNELNKTCEEYLYAYKKDLELLKESVCKNLIKLKVLKL